MSTHRPYSPRSSRLVCLARGGLTLVELLVVIAIIGVLAALTLQVLGRAKDRAIRTIDINNLKQIITATHLYATDNSDYMPWPNWGAPLYPGWLFTYDATKSGPNRFLAQTGVLWPTLQNTNIYWCPQDSSSHPMFKYRVQQSSSYVMNGAVNGFDRNIYPPLRLGMFGAEDVMFWEADEQDPGFFNDGASMPQEGVSTRHEMGAVYATFGGAAYYAKYEDYYREVISTNKTRLWCYPESADGR